MDMEISDDESEDGQISKYEQEEEKDRKLFKAAPSPVDEPVTMDVLEKCRLSRDLLAKYCMTPWFQDYVQSALLRSSFLSLLTIRVQWPGCDISSEQRMANLCIGYARS
jgi:hypothetical protein